MPEKCKNLEFEKFAYNHIKRILDIVEGSKIETELGFELRTKKVKAFDLGLRQFKEARDNAIAYKKDKDIGMSLFCYRKALELLEEIYTPISYMLDMPMGIWDDISRIYITNDFLHEGLIAKRVVFLYLKGMEPILKNHGRGREYYNEIYWTTKVMSDKLSKEGHLLEALKYENERLINLLCEHEYAFSKIMEAKVLARMCECHAAIAFTFSKLGNLEKARVHIEEYYKIKEEINEGFLIEGEIKTLDRIKESLENLESSIIN